MICSKCKTNLEPGSAFCPVCGERTENSLQQKGNRVRKEYNTAAYILLDLFGGGLLFGINDFYAGYIKIGLIRFLSTVIGFALGLSTSNLMFLFFPGISCLVGFIELFGVMEKAYAHKNGAMFIRPLDLIYDRKGTENLVRIKYGCELPIKMRKKYNTAVYIILWLFLGGWSLATNDFYAGYIKAGIFRISLMILGAVLGAATKQIAVECVLIGISCIIGFIELFFIGEKQYMLKNGNLVLVRPLDLIYDRRGTEAALIATYGCGLANR